MTGSAKIQSNNKDAYQLGLARCPLGVKHATHLDNDLILEIHTVRGEILSGLHGARDERN